MHINPVVPSPYNFAQENKGRGENHEREHPKHERQRRTRQARRAGTLQKFKWGGEIPASSCCASSRCS